MVSVNGKEGLPQCKSWSLLITLNGMNTWPWMKNEQQIRGANIVYPTHFYNE